MIKIGHKKRTSKPKAGHDEPQVETIDDTVDEILSQKSPQSVAVQSLISIDKNVPGELTSDVETKTDLTADEIKLHTVVETVSSLLMSTPEQFKKRNIFGDLITKKERKSLSKDRLSRREIVEIARWPDMGLFGGYPGMGGGMGVDGMGQMRRPSFLRRLFRGRRTDNMGSQYNTTGGY